MYLYTKTYLVTETLSADLFDRTLIARLEMNSQEMTYALS